MENALAESDDNRVAHLLPRELEHRERRLDSCFLFPTFWGILGCRIKLLLFEEKVGLKFVESPFSPTASVAAETTATSVCHCHGHGCFYCYDNPGNVFFPANEKWIGLILHL